MFISHPGIFVCVGVCVCVRSFACFSIPFSDLFYWYIGVFYRFLDMSPLPVMCITNIFFPSVVWNIWWFKYRGGGPGKQARNRKSREWHQNSRTQGWIYNCNVCVYGVCIYICINNCITDVCASVVAALIWPWSSFPSGQRPQRSHAHSIMGETPSAWSQAGRFSARISSTIYWKHPKKETYCANDNLIRAWISIHSSLIILPHCSSSFASLSAFVKFSEASLNLRCVQEMSHVVLDPGTPVLGTPLALKLPITLPESSVSFRFGLENSNVGIMHGISSCKD